MTKVGDTIYQFDGNRRTYAKMGFGSGGPIYAKHFAGFQIIGETPQSWLVDMYGEVKVNKKTMRQAGKNGFIGYQWFTAEEMAEAIWIHDHRHQIEQRVGVATFAQLKRVAEILGYDDSR